ncbi:MAG: helix-turn-helix domain-containing protein [Desulfomicrobium sp.]|nr:helix-turn-helix domain-containing protein [Pseudomonadota bacterium]MBV1710894.1 helix-turn-helix domain-containing protein [Desulfomicrobium sp.]MBU4571521.1 helix-turn-helix domain-containing protein [Pseudomonadota bacterium]MBU4594509.1 helix-turn-helix domain-containing protein [Pseudomonadota bacterium]MBV1718627.1 helix-turn-helix domain-containing protein [Desulfomicrobium sp.]
MNVQIIENKSGNPAYAVVPWDEYRTMVERLEELQDIVDADKAMADIIDGGETYPSELVERLVRGDNPVRVWREYRGMTTAALAAAAGVTSSAISQIEGGKRGLSVELLKRLAEVLRVDMDDLVG